MKSKRRGKKREQVEGKRGEEQVGEVLMLLSTGGKVKEARRHGRGAEVAAWRQCHGRHCAEKRNFAKTPPAPVF